MINEPVVMRSLLDPNTPWRFHVSLVSMLCFKRSVSCGWFPSQTSTFRLVFSTHLEQQR